MLLWKTQRDIPVQPGEKTETENWGKRKRDQRTAETASEDDPHIPGQSLVKEISGQAKRSRGLVQHDGHEDDHLQLVIVTHGRRAQGNPIRGRMNHQT